MSSVPFIAEVSSNHGRDLGRATRFIEAAADAGCTGVKFQQFRIDELFAPEALARDPKLRARREWELPESFNADLADAARDCGVQYSSTPFYMDAIGVLEPHVDFFKISSYQVLWLDFLREVARTGKPVVLATGMATAPEVTRAVRALQDGGCARPTLLHCVSLYPTPPEQANLRAIETLRSTYDLPVGWSDHTADPEVVLRAVRRHEASMVEFHMDLDRKGAEYGFGHCWLPSAIQEVITQLEEGTLDAETERRLNAPSEMDGTGNKQPRPDEKEERLWRSDPFDGLRPIRVHRGNLAIPA